jgi:hypothetical protein
MRSGLRATDFLWISLSVVLIASLGLPMTVALAGSPAFAMSAKNSFPDPAAAFPPDTLVYVELTDPVQTFDTLETMDFWPEAVTLMTELAGVPGLGAQPLEKVIDDLSTWEKTSRFRALVALLGGRRIAAGWVPVPESSGTAPVIVMQSDRPGDPLSSLTWLCRRFTGGLSMLCEKDLETHAFRIEDHEGRTRIKGRETACGLVFSLPEGVEAMNRVASALSDERGPDREFLADTKGFKDAVAGLPADFSIRIYLDTPALLERIDECPALSRGARKLARKSLAGMSPIGIARKIEADRIRVWISGRMIEEEFERVHPGILDSLGAVEDPLFMNFPESALCTYEVGLHPESMLRMISSLIHAGAPCLHSGLQDFMAKFRKSTGSDPAVDLFPFLEPHLAAAWLPPDQAADGWSFPRTVLLSRLKDREAVDRFLSRLFAWEAGALAPWTSGLISAHVVLESRNGVELKGLKLDSPIGMPLPSPCFALTEDLLIFSPLRSAVIEVLAIVQGEGIGLSKESFFQPGGIQPGAVELVHLNSRAWEKDWEGWWGICVSLGGLFLLDREALPAFSMDQKALHDLGAALFKLMGKLERASGSTSLDGAGRFLFRMEMPVQPAT